MVGRSKRYQKCIEEKQSLLLTDDILTSMSRATLLFVVSYIVCGGIDIADLGGSRANTYRRQINENAITTRSALSQSYKYYRL